MSDARYILILYTRTSSSRMTVDEAWEEKWFRDAVHAWGCAIMVMGKNLGRLVVCIVHEFDVEAHVCVSVGFG